jgi:hypothetical protein
MVNVDILDEIHSQWIEFYKLKKSEKPLEYPTLKVFTMKMLIKIMKKNKGSGSVKTSVPDPHQELAPL